MDGPLFARPISYGLCGSVWVVWVGLGQFRLLRVNSRRFGLGQFLLVSIGFSQLWLVRVIIP